jgi:hypothetical protein
MVGRIELHHHHCCALKNYASFPNLKGLAHLEVWVFWTKLEMMRFGGSNWNVSFYCSILFYFSKPRGYVCFTYMKIVIWWSHNLFFCQTFAQVGAYGWICHHITSNHNMKWSRPKKCCNVIHDRSNKMWCEMWCHMTWSTMWHMMSPNVVRKLGFFGNFSMITCGVVLAWFFHHQNFEENGYVCANV